MFGKNKLSTDQYTDLVSNDCNIFGDIFFSGTIKIQGQVRGESLTADASGPNANASAIIVDKDGVVLCKNIFAHDIIIAGMVQNAEIKCENTIHIMSTADLKHVTIYSRNIKIDEGAALFNCMFSPLDSRSDAEQV